LARIAVQNTVASPKIVTLPQQSASFCQKKPESPKKAAIAIVFGLMCDALRDVNSRVMHVLLRTGRSQAGVWFAKVMGELYRLKVDRTEKGQGQ
jgi:hypothetical protein